MTTLDDAIARAQLPLVVRGPMSADEQGAERVGVLDVSRGARVIFDERMAVDAADPRVHGQWDVMYWTRWKYAWGRAAGDAPFAIYDRRGARLRVVGDGLVELRGILRSERVRVQRVEAKLSEGWLVRSVVAVDLDGKLHVVARRRELSVVIDPTYDGIALMLDAEWVTSLARSLADALAVPWVADKDLG